MGTRAVSAQRTGRVTDVKKASFISQWIYTNVPYGSVSCWSVPCWCISRWSVPCWSVSCWSISCLSVPCGYVANTILGSYYNMLFIASKLWLHYKKLTYFGAYVLKCETFPSTICGPTSRKGVTLYGSGFGGMISLLMACR